MSMTLAKAGHRGDPGLFGFLGNVAKGLVSTFVPGGGAIIKGVETVAGLVSGNKSKPLNPSIIPRTLPAAAQSLLKPAINVASVGGPFPVIKYAPPVPQLPVLRPGVPQLPDSVVTRGGVTIPGLYSGGGSTTTYYSPPAAHPSQNGACPKGMHLNKVGYYTKGQGWIAPLSMCVKNRRRNPLNPRALSRSMARLSSAKNAARFLGRVSIRDPECSKCK